jgi:hypothetical protein
MVCPSCRSVKQAEFTAEMIIHSPGLKNIDRPGFWLFPELLVCLDCGFCRFTVSETELACKQMHSLPLFPDDEFPSFKSTVATDTPPRLSR